MYTDKRQNKNAQRASHMSDIRLGGSGVCVRTGDRIHRNSVSVNKAAVMVLVIPYQKAVYKWGRLIQREDAPRVSRGAEGC